MALTYAFQLAQGQNQNVYTHFRYALHILNSHVAIWKEHGLLTTKEGSITSSGQIMDELKASHLPKDIEIIHR